MKTISRLLIIYFAALLTSCSMLPEPVKKIGLGNRVLNYQGEDTVSSLIIPPDLTEPSLQSDFNDQYSSENKTFEGIKVDNVELKRDSFRRWLVVNKTPSEVWPWAKQFLKSYGFKIEKEDQKVGVMETGYLENDINVPDKSLGAIRAMLSKALKTKYGLPIADKYRIRVEESASKKSSEIYLTLTSIEEVVNGGMRVWQARAKDVELETEMLLRLMVFLGSDRSEAIEKITNSLEVDKPQVMVNKAENGYAELIFPFDQRQTWDYLGWALDELDVDIEDLDVTEGSYYVNIVTNKGLFARLMPSSIQRKTYQLFVKELDKANSIVVFNDLSEENEQDTIDFSFDLFNEIAAKF